MSTLLRDIIYIPETAGPHAIDVKRGRAGRRRPAFGSGVTARRL